MIYQMEPKLDSYTPCGALIKCCYFSPDLTTNMDSSDDFGFILPGNVCENMEAISSKEPLNKLRPNLIQKCYMKYLPSVPTLSLISIDTPQWFRTLDVYVLHIF